jgi:hypothetical protein
MLLFIIALVRSHQGGSKVVMPFSSPHSGDHGGRRCCFSITKLANPAISSTTASRWFLIQPDEVGIARKSRIAVIPLHPIACPVVRDERTSAGGGIMTPTTSRLIP